MVETFPKNWYCPLAIRLHRVTSKNVGYIFEELPIPVSFFPLSFVHLDRK